MTVQVPVVVGVDLSLTCTGIAVSSGPHRGLHQIKTTGRADAGLTDRSTRLTRIVRDINNLRVEAGASLVVIEGPSLGQTRQAGTHDRSGLWWLVVQTCTDWGVPIVEVAPACRARYATGRGNASKDEVLAQVVRRWPDWDVVDNNTADALVLASMGARYLGHPIDAVPALQQSALEAVRWPPT